MSKKKRPVQKPEQKYENDEDKDKERCPFCGSICISGLVASFWDDPNISYVDWNLSSTEIGPERVCNECENEWDADEIQE